MIVDDIADALWFKDNDAYVDGRDRPPLVVYIDYDTHHKMMSEIRGQVSPAAMEMVHKQTIHGWPVYLVNSKEHGWKVLNNE